MEQLQQLLEEGYSPEIEDVSISLLSIRLHYDDDVLELWIFSTTMCVTSWAFGSRAVVGGTRGVC